jgi:hypothetical protein
MDRRATMRGTTLVWIDTDEAIIVRWADRATVERVLAEDGRGIAPTGGTAVLPRQAGASPTGAREASARRDGLRSFLARVAMHVPDQDDVHVVGPGNLRSRLERCLREQDRAHGRRRMLHTAAADRLSEWELVTRVRDLAGDRPVPDLVHR